MTKSLDPPTDQEIIDAISRDDHMVFWAEEPWCVFDREVTKIERISGSSFHVTLRTYETEVNLTYLSPEAEIPVSGYAVECELSFDETSSEWKTENWKDHEEIDPADISSFGNSEYLLSRLGEVIIDGIEPEELRQVNLDFVRSSLRPLIIEKL
jgi:hypothetical protein